MRRLTCCCLLAAALLSSRCRAARLASCAASCFSTSPPSPPPPSSSAAALVDQRAVLEAAETGTVPLNTLLVAISQSPRLPETRDSLLSENAVEAEADLELATRFGPFGVILETDSGAPSDRQLLEQSEPLTPEDFDRAQYMPLLPQPDDQEDPLNSEAHFEGDIIIPLNDFVAINEESAAIEPHKLWPGAVLHYAMSRQFNRRERAVIARAVMEFERHTCLKVMPLPPGDETRHYVHVVKRPGCYSGVGRMESSSGRSQELSLGEGCIFPGIVMHEFMHAFGFWHEQSRPDRDEHVFVDYDNIKPAMRLNFKKYESDKVATLGEPYDIGSIMHYGRFAFAVNKRRPTLYDIRNTGITMGQRRAFSVTDIRKLNRLYGCDGGVVPPTVTPPDGGDCTDDQKFCAFWARRGECAKNPKYMHKFCRRACKLCTDGTCTDLNRLCKGWSTRKQCSRNPSYMLTYCRKSCKVCKDDKTCQDLHRLCDFWARTDECSQNPDFMHLYCRTSCRRC